MKTTNRTQAEIDGEIAELTRIKPIVRKYGLSGDNREAIAAQIATLRDKLTDNEIYDRFDDSDPDDEDADVDAGMYVVSCAQEARNWMTGQTDEAPHTGWLPLVEG